MYRDLPQAFKHVILRVMIDIIITLAKKTHITMYISSHFSGKMTSFQGKWFGFQKNNYKPLGMPHALGIYFLEEEPIIGIQEPSFSCTPTTLDGAFQDPSIFISPVRKKT